MPVRCKDGALGELADLVIDPSTRRVTHLVVQPHGSVVDARLVPIEWAEGSEEQQAIALRCTTEDFGGLDAVREFTYERVRGLPVDDEDWDVGIVDVLAAPSLYSPELGMSGYPADVGMTYDRIPKDDVELRRSSPVQSCDGRDLGHVEALIVDEQDRVTHFVLQHRHLWARRNIKIPVAAIKEMDTDVVTIALTKAQVRALPVEKARRQ